MQLAARTTYPRGPASTGWIVRSVHTVNQTQSQFSLAHLVQGAKQQYLQHLRQAWARPAGRAGLNHLIKHALRDRVQTCLSWLFRVRTLCVQTACVHARFIEGLFVCLNLRDPASSSPVRTVQLHVFGCCVSESRDRVCLRVQKDTTTLHLERGNVIPKPFPPPVLGNSSNTYRALPK